MLPIKMIPNPFSKLVVIELASVLAGPSVGQFFAELGTKVIKIENPKTGGDVTRSWKLASENKENTISSYYASANWGKENVIADISNKTDLEKVYQLIEKADIVIASYKPGDAKKLKVDYDSIKKINSTIIYGLITGYGENNSRVGYDAIIQAETGFTFMNGDKNGNAVKMPVAMMDLMAAHQLKEGLLAALYVREKTGIGDCVTISLFDAGVSSLANQATNYLMCNQIPQRIGSDHPNIVPYGTIFNTKDEKMIVLAIGSDKQFEELCTILNCNEIAKDEKYATNYKRVQNREELKEILSLKIKSFLKDDLLEKLVKVHVPAGAVNNLEEVFETEEAKKLVLSKENIKGIRNKAFRSLNLKNIDICKPSKFEKDV